MATRSNGKPKGGISRFRSLVASGAYCLATGFLWLSERCGNAAKRLTAKNLKKME